MPSVTLNHPAAPSIPIRVWVAAGTSPAYVILAVADGFPFLITSTTDHVYAAERREKVAERGFAAHGFTVATAPPRWAGGSPVTVTWDGLMDAEAIAHRMAEAPLTRRLAARDEPSTNR